MVTNNKTNQAWLDNPNLSKVFKNLGVNQGNTAKVAGQFDSVVKQVKDMGLNNLDCVSPCSNSGKIDPKKITNATPHSYATIMLYIMQGIVSTLPKAQAMHFERAIKLSQDPITSSFTLDYDVWNGSLNQLPKTPNKIKYRNVNKELTPKTLVQRIRQDASSHLGKLAKALTPKADPKEPVTFRKQFYKDIKKLMDKINKVDGDAKACKSIETIDIDKVKQFLIHLQAQVK